MKRTYEEVMDKINNARRFENHPGVEVTAAMLEALGHPEKGIPFIHVAGTNGKGSTCAFLTSILQENGSRIGVFTSPHLVDFEERITINGKQISKDQVEAIGNFLLDQQFPFTPTMFDYSLLMALLYFNDQAVDGMILETGLGGRLDSTNAVGIPLVAVITKIGFDHVEILGHSLSAIAGEKAGILKEGSKVVLQRQEAEAADVLAQVCRNNKLPEKAVHFLTDEEVEEAGKLPLKLLGVHQWENAATAAAGIRLLAHTIDENDQACFGLPRDRQVLERLIREGLCKAEWPGRMELLSSHPFLMVDGAHNGHGVKALAQSLKTLYPGQKFHFIMAVMADKDYQNMIGELLPLAIDFVTYAPESSRALQSRDLKDCIAARGVEAREGTSMADLFDHLPEKEKTICFGSLYFIGEVKAYLGSNPV